MSKINSVPVVRNALTNAGVLSQNINEDHIHKHKPTKTNPDFIVTGQKQFVVITAVSTARERWQLHDWRALRILQYTSTNKEFRILQGLDLKKKISFHLILTDDADPGFWRLETANLTGKGLTSMFHVDDDEKMGRMINECLE